jgi:hypothetical protein
MCQKCQNGRYLHNGRCISSCGGTGAFPFANTRTAGVGYRCISEFTCDENLDGQCLCPNVDTGIRCKTCNIRGFNETFATYECTACNDPALLLVQGRCSEALNCRNGFYVDKIRPGRLTNVPCDCGVTTNDCQECLLNYNTTILGPNKCLRCKNNKFFLNGTCGTASLCTNAGLIGSQTTTLGSVGRTCNKPFTCNGGLNVEFGGMCSCPAPKYCLNCAFTATLVAPCSSCTLGSFLNPATGTCVFTCPVGTTADTGLMRCV